MKIKPMPGWVLCRALEPEARTSGGLLLAKDWDKDVKSEGVAQVIAATPPEVGPVAVEEGQYILYRGFLRYCNQYGSLYESAEKDCLIFLLSDKDVLAVVEGPCRLGALGEYVIGGADEP